MPPSTHACLSRRLTDRGPGQRRRKRRRARHLLPLPPGQGPRAGGWPASRLLAGAGGGGDPLLLSFRRRLRHAARQVGAAWVGGKLHRRRGQLWPPCRPGRGTHSEGLNQSIYQLHLKSTGHILRDCSASASLPAPPPASQVMPAAALPALIPCMMVPQVLALRRGQAVCDSCVAAACWHAVL